MNIDKFYLGVTGNITSEATTQFILFSKTYLTFIKDCPYDDALVDWSQWNLQNNVTLTGSLQILLSKVFQVTTVINDVAEAFAVQVLEGDLEG